MKYNLLHILINKYSKSNKRSQDVVKNIGLSLGCKIASVLASLLIVPMTINYINATQYGIWLTISSVIGWVTFFDLGLGNGFRNRFAEAKAQGNILLCRQLTSTTYFTITIIVTIVYIVCILINSQISWSEILKIPHSYSHELSNIFIIVCTFTCLNMIANILGSLLSADQRNGVSSLISAIGQYVSLLVIFVLTKETKGSLTNLAIYYSGVPCFVLVISSIIIYSFTKYKIYRPSINCIKLSLIKKIMGLGIRFFIIYLCMIAIFQIVNVVISREIGPLGVTQYNIANKYIGMLYMVVTIAVTPFWSAFTDAYTKKDYFWMKHMVSLMQRAWLLLCAIGIVFVIASPLFYKIWLGNSVEIPIMVTVAMYILIMCQSLGAIFMQMVNGTGFLRIQTLIYISFALISWPLFTYSSRQFGLVGVIAIPALVYFIQGILAMVQIKKIINFSAEGWWIK